LLAGEAISAPSEANLSAIITNVYSADVKKYVKQKPGSQYL